MLFLLAALCWAQMEGLPGFPERGGFPQPHTTVQATATQYPVKPVRNNQGDLGQSVYSAKGKVPIDQKKKSLLYIGYDFEHQQNRGTARFDSGATVPSQVIVPALSINYATFVDLQNSTGFSAQVSSPSDHPFHSWSETGVTLNYLERFRAGDFLSMNSWFVAVNYSNVRAFLNNIPLPGFGYEWHREKWTWILGVPFFAVFGEPWEKAIFAANYFPTNQGSVSLTQFILGPVQIFAQYTSRAQKFILVDRGLDSDRYVIDRQTAALGLRSPLSRNLSVQLEYGLLFGQVHRIEQRYWDRDFGPRAEVEDSTLTSISLKGNF